MKLSDEQLKELRSTPKASVSVGCEARGHVWNTYNPAYAQKCIVCGLEAPCAPGVLPEPKCADAPIELPALDMETGMDWEDRSMAYIRVYQKTHPGMSDIEAACALLDINALQQREDQLHSALVALSHAQEQLAGKLEKGGGNGVEHQARKIYRGRASYDFIKTGFAVTVAGHKIAECEDSEVADWICKQWNLSPQSQLSANAETAASSEHQPEHDYYNCGDEDCEACREFRRDGDG